MFVEVCYIGRWQPVTVLVCEIDTTFHLSEKKYSWKIFTIWKHWQVKYLNISPISAQLSATHHKSRNNVAYPYQVLCHSTLPAEYSHLRQCSEIKARSFQSGLESKVRSSRISVNTPVLVTIPCDAWLLSVFIDRSSYRIQSLKSRDATSLHL